MKRDFSPIVKDFDGRPHVRARMKYDEKTGMPVMEVVNGVKVHAFDHHEAMTLRIYAMDALGGRWAGEEQIDRGMLTSRVRLYDKLCFSTDGVVDLESPELQLILDALYAQRASALVYGRMEKMLNTDPEAPKAAAAVQEE